MYSGRRERRVEIGVEIAAELVDLVDQNLNAVVATDDQGVEMGQLVSHDARASDETLLAPLLAHGVVVRDDHLNTVRIATVVGTKHHHIRSGAG